MMKRNLFGSILVLTLALLVSPALASTFSFDTGNQGWTNAGLYDGGGLDQISGYFSDGPAGWSAVSGSGALLIGSGGFSMPPSPTSNQFLHWDLNSPDLSTDNIWQGVTSFSYDVTGEYMAAYTTIYVQAILKVRKPDGSTSYFSDQNFHAIPMEAAGAWTTHTVDVTGLGLPTGTTILNVNFRFFFETGSGHDGFIKVDNVTPFPSNNAGSGDSGSSVIGIIDLDRWSLYPRRPKLIDLSRLTRVMEQGNSCFTAQKVVTTFDAATGFYTAKIPASIGYAGDVDWFVVELPATLSLVGMSTTGMTDTVGELYRGCGQKAAGWDDNSGTNLNFSMTTVGTGKLFIKVSHTDPKGTGSYTFNLAYRLMI